MMIRATSPRDHRRILAIHRAAFEEEDLRPLVEQLLALDEGMALTAGMPGDPIAHAFFTECRIVGEGAPHGGARAMLLGPVAVAPAHQKQGIGTALLRDGLRRLVADDRPPVLVLGDPGFYARFGFAPEPGVQTPCAIPDDWAPAWQSLSLDGTPLPAGRLEVPAPWRNPDYWAPPPEA